MVTIIVIDVCIAFCTGMVLEILSVMGSLYAYGIIPGIGLGIVTLGFFFLLSACVWNCYRYRIQSLLRFVFIVIGFVAAFEATIYSGVVVKVCDAFQVDVENNLQGLMIVVSFLGLVLLGGGLSLARVTSTQYKIQRNCRRYYGNGRFQLLHSKACAAEFYDAAEKETVISKVESYAYIEPYCLVCGKTGVVVINTSIEKVIHADSTKDLPESLQRMFNKKRKRRV